MKILRTIALLFLCIVCYWALGFFLLTGHGSFSSRTYKNSENVVLHDGKLITVERKVDWTTNIVLLDLGLGFPTFPHLSKRWPDKFWLKFKHPDTQKIVKWQGEQHYIPVLLDIVDGVPYLVVLGRVSKETEAIYGCPELPYSYLKYETGFFGKWVPVPVENAPDVLRISNLSQDRRNDGGFFQEVIPRTYEEWNYTYKNEHRNERKVGDCRPPLRPLPDVPLPKPVDVELETVESTDYIVKGADEYYKSLSERKGSIIRANCAKLFRPPNPENLMQGERFINDLTGSIRLPYSGPTPFPSGRMLENRAERYCDDKFIWFIAGHEELGKTIITKYTVSGNLRYNIRMDNPKTADNKLARSMVLDSITAENGYFYFYWVQSLPRTASSSMAYPNRMTKLRFREPIHEATSK